MELNEILALTTMRHDLNEEITLRQYFYDLMSALLCEQDGFSGKCPFGNSGWDYEIYLPLVKAGLIKGQIDEDGYIIELDDVEANEFVLTQILQPLFGIKP
jgi:hypothetical protein